MFSAISSRPSPPLFLIVLHIQTAAQQVNNNETPICEPTTTVLHVSFFSPYQSSRPIEKAISDQSSKTNGTYANVRSIRVASSCPSNRKRNIVAWMMETTLVKAELTMRLLAAWDWADVVGWNSSKVSTASDKLPVTAATTSKVM